MNVLAPQAALAVGVVGALGLGLLRRPPAMLVRALALAAPLAALWLLKSAVPDVLPPLVGADMKSLLWLVVILFGALPLAFLSSGDDVETALFLGSVLGMSLLAVAGNLVMLFVGLEFMSLPAYLLVARAGSPGGTFRLEAAIKYFFAGALAGALFLLGLVLYYADTRSLGATLAPLGFQGQAGVALMAAAALFKIGAVPLHWWLPDVYSAAAPEVSGFLATSMKAAAVLFLMRIVSLAPNAAFATALPGLGALTALVGAVLALRQDRLQRLFAYLSLSHAGLLVIGVGAWSALGRSPAATAALLFYLGVDALMSNGAFAFVKASGASTRAELRGYASRRPELAAALAALLFALAGVPPTGGFVAELLIFWQAIHAALAVPIVLGALAALVSLGYCLALVRDVYFEEAVGAAPADGGTPARITVLACAFGSLVLGAAPLLLRGLAGSVWR
ncbi:MAG TPA: proton-conducting transporter membrane subunit [Elusimicrobiota bacterium]|jgi:NADH-quinone oxidoreductase subunit N|nr:proton-conducting transporter membrane subunit [Elusimicrobiota bacterium]